MERVVGDQTELTASGILNTHGECIQKNVLQERDGSVGSHLVHCDGGVLVTVLAGSLLEREPIIFVTLGAYLGGAVLKSELALVGGLVIIGAGRTSFGGGDSLNDVL